ncbi:hypothetical protein GS489_00575 [Rhodococcus hoagii]|nr:hypothetical protein [Prescottella equi]
MSTSTTPVLAVPITAQSLATLTDWLLRSLVPTVLDAADMTESADELCRLAPVSPRRIARPRSLRRHENRAADVIALVETRLQHAPRTSRADGQVDGYRLPDEVLNLAAEIGGMVADSGSSIAALSNRLLIMSAILAGSGDPTRSAHDLHTRVTESYCAVLSFLWQNGLGSELRLKED